MSRKRRPLAGVALIAVVAVINGCGSHAPAGTGTSSGASTSSASGASGGGTPTATHHEKAVKFAECMRHNGVSAFPDPPASGNLTIDGIANGSSLDTNSSAFTQALSACKRLEPAGFTGSTPTSRQTSARLKFAQCMRQNGVPDFPDPTPNGPLIDTNRIPSLAGKDPRSDPTFTAATRKCSSFAAAAGVVAQ